MRPSTGGPGDTVELFFPDERTRGIHFVLESESGDLWNLEYHLISDWGSGRPMEVYGSGEFNQAVPDIGIEGPGPDRVMIPNDASAGEFRICTANSLPNICTLLQVEDR